VALSAETLVPGRVVAARYEILSTLGKGGMGMVYKAHDRLLEETVALKVLRPEVADSPEFGRRFRAEIKLARSVSHKNVCRIHEYGEDGPLRYISMAFLDGVDLRQILREKGPFPPAQALDVCVQIAEGLQAIHDEGIVHRDLKTPNVMMDARGVVRLMDFGIAKQWEADTAASMTAMGQIVGTPEYMSPEHIRGEKLDGRSDLYALGVVAYELFTGHAPFRAETPMGILIKHLNEPPPLEAATDRLPPSVLPVLRRTLAKDRNERYATARELAQALRASGAPPAQAGTLAAAGPAPPAEPTARVHMPQASPRTPVTAQPTTFVPPPTVVYEPGPPVPAAAPRPPSVPAAPPPVTRRLSAAMLALGAGALVLAALAGAWLVRGRASPADAQATSALPAAGGPAAASSVPPLAPPVASTGPGTVAPAVTLPAPPPPSVSRAAGSPRAPARPATSEEVGGLLAEAEAALAVQQHDAALSFYEQALRLDPRNERARIGRDLSLQAAARAKEKPPAPTRAFAAGVTRRQEAASAGPAGFETSAAVAARPVAQAAPPAGKIFFETEPSAVAPADPFTVRVFLVNEGRTPLTVREVLVTTTVNGRGVSGPVSPAARQVAPQQKLLLLSVSDHWKAETASWSMAVSVQTSAGETYRNELAWK
jgi:serine/threonine-protein kinase